MKLLLKINVLLVLVLGSGLALTAFLARQTLQSDAHAEVASRARLLMDFAEATRVYTQSHYGDWFHQGADKELFYREYVPAFATLQTLDTLRSVNESKEYDRYSYKEVSDNPTLPKHKAAVQGDRAYEQELLDYFRTNKRQKEFPNAHRADNVYAVDGAPVLVLARPVEATDKCLVCHDTKERAPPTMLAAYRDELAGVEMGGFGWKAGDVVAVRLVEVPMDVATRKAETLFAQLVAHLAAAAVATLVLLNLALWLLVVRPVVRLADWADQVSRGNLREGELPASGRDEIANMTQAFNRMYRSIRKALELLKRR